MEHVAPLPSSAFTANVATGALAREVSHLGDFAAVDRRGPSTPALAEGGALLLLSYRSKFWTTAVGSSLLLARRWRRLGPPRAADRRKVPDIRLHNLCQEAADDSGCWPSEVSQAAVNMKFRFCAFKKMLKYAPADVWQEWRAGDVRSALAVVN